MSGQLKRSNFSSGDHVELKLGYTQFSTQQSMGARTRCLDDSDNSSYGHSRAPTGIWGQGFSGPCVSEQGIEQKNMGGPKADTLLGKDTFFNVVSAQAISKGEFSGSLGTVLQRVGSSLSEKFWIHLHSVAFNRLLYLP